MLDAILGAGAVAGLGGLAWAVRGKSATVFGTSYWRGPRDRKALAITFDDGPSESTPRVQEILAEFGAKATFFQCGQHVRRHPEMSRRLLRDGHEIGNHTETHAPLYLRSAGFILSELQFAQQTFQDLLGIRPALFRAPYGARWFGLKEAQEELGLTGIMWSMIGRDWKLTATGIAERLKRGTEPGAIFCLHDGRAIQPNPNITPTLDALRMLLPLWRDQGYQLVTVSELLCLPKPPNA